MAMVDTNTLNQALQTALDMQGIPGAAAALVEDNRVIYAGGVGQRVDAAQQPMTADTIFEGVSLGKALYAYGVLKLVAQGALDLDKPLSEYLSQPWERSVPRLSLINTRHILSHRSGLPNWRPQLTSPDGSTIQGRLVVEALPGEQFSYSGEAFDYLQHVVEQITGQPTEAWMRQMVFEPLGMTDSSYLWQPHFEGRGTDGESLEGIGIPLRRFTEAHSAYSLLTSAPDYARFLVAMLNPADGTAAQMLTPQGVVGDQARLRWGLGWGIQHLQNRQVSCWHWGASRGYRSFAVFNPTAGRGIVLLTNSAHGFYMVDAVLAAAGFDAAQPALQWLLPPEQWRADGRHQHRRE